MSKGKASIDAKHHYNELFINSFASQYQFKLLEIPCYPLSRFIKHNNFNVPLRTAKDWLEARAINWFGHYQSDARGCYVVAYFNDSRTSGSLVTMRSFYASSDITVTYVTFTRWMKKYVAQVLIGFNNDL